MNPYILIDRLFPILGILIGVLVILLQDNAVGNLDTWGGLWWSVQKCMVVCIFFNTLFVLSWIGRKLSDYALKWIVNDSGGGDGNG